MAGKKNPKTAIEIGVNERPAVAGLKRLAGDFGRTSVQMNQSLELVGKAWGVLSGAIGGAVAIASEFIELAAEQERVERRAIAAIRSRSEFTRAEFEALQASNAERQRALGIGDEEQLQLQGTLSAMGLRKDQLNAATEATIGLAEATGQDLAAASRLIVRAFAGETSALSRYGIRVDSVAEAQTELARLFEVAQAQSSTLTTRTKVLSAAYGDLKEQIGAVLNESDGAAESLDALTGFVEDLGTYLRSADGIALVDDMARAVAGLAADAINAALGFKLLATDIENALAKMDPTGGRAGALANLTNPLFLLSEGMGGISGEVERLISGEAFTEATVGNLELYQRLADRLQGIATGGRDDGFVGPPAPTGGGGRGPRRPRRPPGAPSGRDEGLGAHQFGPKPLQGEALRMHLEESELEHLGGMTDAQREALEEAREIANEIFEQHKDDRQQTQEAILAQDRQFFGSMMSIATSSLSNFARAVATGSASIGEALRGMVGGIISSFGEMMIQLGSAAVLAGTLGTIAPIFAPGTGGPLGVGAGVALIAGGAAMVGIGAALGGRGGGAASTPTATPSSVGSTSRARLPDSPFARGFEGGPGFGGAMQAAASTVVVNFNGIVDSRRAAREIRDVLGATS